jgi:uncharacterized protein
MCPGCDGTTHACQDGPAAPAVAVRHSPVSRDDSRDQRHDAPASIFEAEENPVKQMNAAPAIWSLMVVPEQRGYNRESSCKLPFSSPREGKFVMPTAEYDPLYLRGIEFFNDCEFFESHEAWEELWTEYQGPSRKFYQGLIQAAVALHHFGNGNIRGAKKLYYTSLGYLEAYRPLHEGIDLDKFFAEMQRCFASIINSDEDFPAVEIVADEIPEIHLDPAPGAAES